MYFQHSILNCFLTRGLAPSPRASFIRLIRSVRVQKRINVPFMNQLMSIYVSKEFHRESGANDELE